MWKRFPGVAAWLLLVLTLAVGCSPRDVTEGPEKSGGFVLLTRERIPEMGDDLDAASLRTAIERSLSFYSKEPAERTYLLGTMPVSVERLRATLTRFRDLLEAGELNRETLSVQFDIYQVAEGADSALVTGYYEPVLQGAVDRTSEFCYPIYALPPDLMSIDLESFDPARFAGRKLVGRLDGKRLVPYFSRAEIDLGKALEPHRCELVWLRDPLDAFFLQVQGSGNIMLAGGGSMRVGYAGSNGRPYRSIGKALIDRGLLKREEVTLQTIRSFLDLHPELRDEVLCHNESYVFFRPVREGPVGSLNVLLTEGRSVAMDPQMHPRGALALLSSEKPRFDTSGECTGWDSFTRWVLNQDTGGAIKGVGRLDLFCGSGKAAEAMAGRLKHPGVVWFPLLKEGAGDQ